MFPTLKWAWPQIISAHFACIGQLSQLSYYTPPPPPPTPKSGWNSVFVYKITICYLFFYTGKHYPFYGTQWHPEIAMFEWKPKGVNHSANAILAAQFVANFFVDESRKNSHKFVSKAKEEKSLIYNYVPEHDRDVITFYEQAYIF